MRKKSRPFSSLQGESAATESILSLVSVEVPFQTARVRAWDLSGSVV